MLDADMAPRPDGSLTENVHCLRGSSTRALHGKAPNVRLDVRSLRRMGIHPILARDHAARGKTFRSCGPKEVSHTNNSVPILNRLSASQPVRGSLM